MLSAEDALHHLCNPESRVSAHFLINKEGIIYELVDPGHRAWHAGVSFWQGDSDINSRSIGIELDNLGHTFGPEPFPSIQIVSLLKLLEELTQTYAIPPHRIVGHSDVAPLRKKDPGELFPWAELASHGFSIWPAAKNLPYAMNITEIQKALADIGYFCPATGVWDEHTQQVCLAFQRHFVPDKLTGIDCDITCQKLIGYKQLASELPRLEIA
jgi:N-acetylmuramoyl-L-alanine amidase